MAASAVYAATQGQPPVPTLLLALQHWPGPAGLALDLGCGAGRDTLELLRRGWQVLAIDKEAEALQRLQAQVPPDQTQQLESRLARFEDAALPPAQLVNSSFALPFCPPDRFPELWLNIERALAEGGLFAGHFFGERDEWVNADLTICNRQQLEARFAHWELLPFDEVERDAPTAKRANKHWHLFSIVARRR